MKLSILPKGPDPCPKGMRSVSDRVCAVVRRIQQTRIFFAKTPKIDYNMPMIYRSKSPKETQNIASDLVKKHLNKFKPKGAAVIALEGELGAGKTVFAKGLAGALKARGKVKSPTFILMKKYKLPAGKHLYHLDCYRLKNEKDLIGLGIKEIINDPQNIVIMEWSERVKKILPKRHIKVHIDHISEKERKISIQ